MAVPLTVKRNSGLFTPEQADELNKSFQKINELIDNYQAIDLEYKEDIKLLNNTTHSFRAGKLVCFREVIPVKAGYDEFTQVSTIDISVPYDIWTVGITKEHESLFVHIKNNQVFVYGHLTHYPQELVVVFDAVVP